MAVEPQRELEHRLRVIRTQRETIKRRDAQIRALQTEVRRLQEELHTPQAVNVVGFRNRNVMGNLE